MENDACVATGYTSGTKTIMVRGEANVTFDVITLAYTYNDMRNQISNSTDTTILNECMSCDCIARICGKIQTVLRIICICIRHSGQKFDSTNISEYFYIRLYMSEQIFLV